MTTPPDFVHLHVHSQYSILDGQASIQKLVDKAMRDGQPGIALTDHGNMFGIKEFYNYVKKVKGKYKAQAAEAEARLAALVDGWLHTGDLATMDTEGYVTVRGRSKNMLLTASGQNIYPEEIESKLNNMPYVSESLIVLQNDKLVALIYPDFDDAFAHGMEQSDIEKVMEDNRNELNLQLPAYCQITKVKIHFEEFEKTAKKSIKRFMYQEVKG